ncbi:MAG: O-antigen ligase family protein [Bacteroidales bacterium]|nr:O-antigen ligase family protein [Bacteroidales bacterium]
MTSTITSGQKIKEGIAWIHYAIALLMAASISFADALMLKIYFAWACTWFIDLLLNKGYLRARFQWKNAAAYAFGIFYLLMLISLLYSDNMLYAGRQLERRLAFIITAVMAIFGFNEKYKLKQLLLAFVIGSMLSLLYSVALPFIEYSMQSGERYLFQKSAYDQFVNIAMSFKHRSYFGIIQLMALASLWHLRKDLTEAWGRRSFMWIMLLYSAFLLLHLFFLKGRAPLLALVGLSILFVFSGLGKRHKKWLIPALLLVMLGIWALWQFHPRFERIQWQQIQSSTLSLDEKDNRLAIWHSCLQLIFEDGNWMSGVGSGDIKDQFNEICAKENMNIGTLHAHNTLLNTWLELGLAGLLVVIFIMLWPLLTVGKEHRSYLWSLCIPLYILMMVESFTQPIHGIIPWVFFVLLAANIDKETTKEIGEIGKLNYVCYGIFAIMAVLWISFVDMEREYDPRNPRSYAQGNHYSIVKELPAPVPAELDKCKGYRIAAGAESIYREKQHAADFISSLYLPDTSYKSFSAWCYVSEDFDGSGVKIQSFRVREGKEIFTSHEYDLRRKGSWQLLTIDVSEMDKYANCSFFIRKYGVENLDELQGYVIFALPLFHK